MALKGKFAARGTSGRNWVKGPDGKFDGSVSGGASAGRIAVARKRLRKALERVEKAREERATAKDPFIREMNARLGGDARANSFKALYRLRKAKNAVAVHQSEVSRLTRAKPTVPQGFKRVVVREPRDGARNSFGARRTRTILVARQAVTRDKLRAVREARVAKAEREAREHVANPSRALAKARLALKHRQAELARAEKRGGKGLAARRQSVADARAELADRTRESRLALRTKLRAVRNRRRELARLG